MELKPGYKQTEVGVVPEDWIVGTLDQFWSVIDCKHVTASYTSAGYPVASIREVQAKYVDLGNCKYTDKHFFDLLTEGGRQPKDGDLIMSRNATVGEVAQVTKDHPQFAMGQDVCLLQRRDKDLSPTYLQALLQSPIIAKQLASTQVGSTFKRANVEQIRSLKVAMPPLPEQKAIDEQLDFIDDQIFAISALIAKKRAIKQAAMQELLTGKRRLPGFEGEWEVKRLGELGTWRGGMTPSMQNPSYWVNGDFPWISSGDIKISQLSETSQNVTSQAVKQGAAVVVPAQTIVLVTRSGILRKHLPVALIDKAMAINQDIKALIPYEGICSTFLLHALTWAGDQILASCMKSGTTVESVEFSWLKAFVLPIPLIEEQEAIASVLSDMDAEISALDAQRNRTRAIKQAMMQELLTGRIRLR
jgi:type I restriction enzyme S subunit